MARGPAYPYLDLESAVSLARKTYEFTKRSFAPLDAVTKEAWGYSPTSSSGVKTSAAMKYYGLIEANDAGSVRLTDRAYRIVVDDPTSEEWLEAVREAALSPRWYRFCWETWGVDMPVSMKRTLLFDHGFVDTTVDGFLKDYRKTVEFAKLTEMRTLEESSSDEPDNPPRRAQGNSDPRAESQKGDAHPRIKSPIGANMRQEVFSLPEGTVAVEWPGDLSQESFQDLSDWLDILKRKIGRAANLRAAETKLERGGETGTSSRTEG